MKKINQKQYTFRSHISMICVFIKKNIITVVVAKRSTSSDSSLSPDKKIYTLTGSTPWDKLTWGTMRKLNIEADLKCNMQKMIDMEKLQKDITVQVAKICHRKSDMGVVSTELRKLHVLRHTLIAELILLDKCLAFERNKCTLPFLHHKLNI